MTVEEKRNVVNDYCTLTTCDECTITNWCNYNVICDCSESSLDMAVGLINAVGEDDEDDEDDKPNKQVNDKVNHPSHYTNGMECIDEMIMIFGIDAVMTFCKLNVWKYRKRALHKNGQEDMDKSNWYINKYLELKEKCGEWKICEYLKK